MNDEYAFVGDIHANLTALQAMRRIVDDIGVAKVVFLGDYINKGADSARVIEELYDFQRARDAVLLAGNHEHALLSAVDRKDLSGFIKMGGAMTIRSYVGRPVGPDVLGDLIDCLPSRHLELLRAMPTHFETDHLIAQHVPTRQATRKFHISAHVPVGQVPLIGEGFARLDTGCGSGDGRLTAFMWPSMTYVQVDNCGRQINPSL